MKTDFSNKDIVSELDEVDASDPTSIEITADEPSQSTASPTAANKVLRESQSASAKRQRLISTSLTTTPIVDGEFEDYHQHKLTVDADKFDPKYKLYAVVVSKKIIDSNYSLLYSVRFS